MRRIVVFVLVVASMALSGIAFAGERAGAVSISPFIGGYTFDGSQHLKTRPVYGLRLGYDLTDNWEAEGVFDYVSSETTGKHPVGANSDLHAYSYRLDVLYNFMPKNVLVPYLAVGGGGTTTELDANNHDDTSATFNFGGGVKYFMTDSIALRADLRHLLVFGSTPPGQTDEHTLNNWEYTLGLTFLFGGKTAAVQAVAAEPAPAPAPEAVPKEAPLEPIPAAQPEPGRYKYCITLHIEFDIDKADIRPEFNDEVAKVGDFMKKYPDTAAIIEGHTDNVGTAEHNMELSQKRAESVVNYLVNNFGIDRSRLTAKGFGMTRPVVDNATDEGRQTNRRIEAVIDCAVVPQEVKPPQRLCMGLQVQFDTGRAEIKPEYHSEIAKVGDYMKKYPDTTGVIEGHTDNVGASDFNMKLSQKRAESVVNYLVEKFGIDRSRLTAKGFGSTRRIAYNSTAEGRQKNRRIDAVIDCVVRP